MKRVLAIVAGVVSGFIVVFVGDATVHAMHPMPVGLDYTDKAVMLHYITQIPTYVMVTLAFFWILSSFTGGLVTGAIMNEGWQRASLTTGGILFAATLLNLLMTAPAHPAWMWITAVAGFIPAAFLGAWLMRRNKFQNPTV